MGSLMGLLKSSRLAVYLTLVLGALSAGILGWASGFNTGYGQAEALGQAAYASLENLHTKSLLHTERAARARLQTEQAKVVALSDELTRQNEQLEAARQQLKRRINHVTTVYRPAPDAPVQAVPELVLTWGFVRLWNAAIGAGGPRLPEAGAACGADPQAGTAQGVDARLCRDELNSSGVSQADLLAHITDYGQRCQGIERQLNAWIEFSHHL